jgi:hypothetical protein
VDEKPIFFNKQAIVARCHPNEQPFHASGAHVDQVVLTPAIRFLRRMVQLKPARVRVRTLTEQVLSRECRRMSEAGKWQRGFNLRE